ncbi:GDP-fucose synthetase [candidate division WWE3 bacterium CG10_big_fil_rev_8_21_14_0_10_32_10]|uniref:GDP-L-fucose synthase n=1 Tax=candidate division WWE3 bacterium CG10_big_fil_rev_8_21_14_0_10_32_10 TaxID=1975090 RepID=A0A2H0RCP9_UNCKA|nr:MAG: GDP-fucose synthetase [candidate division WWE3 bacterium CG10_big_fil_rev_8_21_14_0_10_32_10]
MQKKSKIYIAGHTGLVGSAIKRKLVEEGYTNLIYKTHKELDLMNKKSVDIFFREEKPEYIFLAAAKVGGILANSRYPAEFLYNNLVIQNNIIHLSYLHDVNKLLFLGSTCIYPKIAPQPLNEKYLLSGYLESTNEPYAIAKIAGIKMCQSYNRQYNTNSIAAMPTNLYGPNDNFDLKTGHVLPAFIRKFSEAKKNNAKSVTIWGTGTPRREFIHVDDMADACLFLMQNFNPTPEQNELGDIFLNIGCGEDIELNDLAKIIAKIIGYKGKIKHDLSKPDGTPRKLVDVSKLFSLGWKPKISLNSGIKSTYKWYIYNYEK